MEAPPGSVHPLTLVKIVLNADGSLSQDTKTKLYHRRRALHGVIESWMRVLRFGRKPIYKDYCATVDELMDLDRLLETGHNLMDSQESDAIDAKIEHIFEACQFTDELPIGAANQVSTVACDRSHEVSTPEGTVVRPEMSSSERQTFDTASQDSKLITFERPESQSSIQPTHTGPPRDDEEDSAGLCLKDIPLPTFDDKVHKWLTFWPKFDALVHTNKKVCYLEKGVRLEQCLVGPATRWVKDLMPTKTSYLQVIANLKAYFESPSVQKHAFNERLKQMSKIDDRFDVAAMRTLWSTASNTLTQARQLQINESYVNNDVMPLIKRLLPAECQYSINMKRPKVENLEDFISELLIQIESTEQYLADNGHPSASSYTRSAPVKVRHPDDRFLPTGRVTRVNQATTTYCDDMDRNVCVSCHGWGHSSTRCPYDQDVPSVGGREGSPWEKRQRWNEFDETPRMSHWQQEQPRLDPWQDMHVLQESRPMTPPVRPRHQVQDPIPVPAQPRPTWQDQSRPATRQENQSRDPVFGEPAHVRKSVPATLNGQDRSTIAPRPDAPQVDPLKREAVFKTYPVMIDLDPVYLDRNLYIPEPSPVKYEIVQPRLVVSPLDTSKTRDQDRQLAAVDLKFPREGPDCNEVNETHPVSVDTGQMGGDNTDWKATIEPKHTLEDTKQVWKTSELVGTLEAETSSCGISDRLIDPCMISKTPRARPSRKTFVVDRESLIPEPHTTPILVDSQSKWTDARSFKFRSSKTTLRIGCREASTPRSHGLAQVKTDWTIDLKSLLKCAQLVTDLSMLISLYLHIRFKWTLFFWHLRRMACEPRHPEADQYWTDQPVDSFAWWPLAPRMFQAGPVPEHLRPDGGGPGQDVTSQTRNREFEQNDRTQASYLMAQPFALCGTAVFSLDSNLSVARDL